MTNSEARLIKELSLQWGPLQTWIHRIGKREWEEWKTYYQIRSFGNEAEDLRAGIVASVITGKRPIDHMPIVAAINNTPSGIALSDAELLEKAKNIAARFQGMRGANGQK